MNLKILKILKEHFELMKVNVDSKNKNLEKLLEDKVLIEKCRMIKLGISLPDFSLDEDVMRSVLVHHNTSSIGEKIYIDCGSWVLTGMDPRMLNCSVTYIKESDIEYVKNIIENNNNPLIYQSLVHEYYDLISGLSNYDIPSENELIIKPPSLIERENSIPSYKEKIDYKEPGMWEKLGKSMLKVDDIDYTILRSQFYLRLIKENPEEVINYYKDIDNWPVIEENVQKYYVKKKELSDNIHSKLSV